MCWRAIKHTAGSVESTDAGSVNWVKPLVEHLGVLNVIDFVSVNPGSVDH